MFSVSHFFLADIIFERAARTGVDIANFAPAGAVHRVDGEDNTEEMQRRIPTPQILMSAIILLIEILRKGLRLVNEGISLRLTFV